MENQFSRKDSFLYINGQAKNKSDMYSNKKLCFVATDKGFLMSVLVELSAKDNCYFVKLTDEPRDGMYLGRCFMTDEESVGTYWAKYKLHPKLMCNIQDDDFSNQFRESIVSYRNSN